MGTRTRRAVFTLYCAALFVLSATAVQAQDLRIGLMPAVDSIPLIVAQAQGYFEAEGISVELVMFRDQLYRETALQTFAIDGSVSDMINAINARHNGFDVRITSATDGLFALALAPGSALDSAEAWNARGAGGVTVGSLENSIINYVMHRMLAAAGVDPRVVRLVPTMQVPARMEMVVNGQIEAGVLPEPITQLAVARGARVFLDTRVLQSTPGVVLFTARALQRKATQVGAFYRAYNRAVAAVNANPDAFREVIVERGQFPPTVRDTMVIPTYRAARLPTEAEYTDVEQWMIARGMVQRRVPYAEAVATSALQ